MNVFESYPDIEEPDAASNFLYTFLAENGTSETYKPSIEICATCLKTDLTLRRKLRTAHEKRDIEGIEWFRGAWLLVLSVHLSLSTSTVHLQRNSWRYKHPLSSTRVNERIQHIEASGKIVLIVRGEFAEPIWTPREESSNPDLTSHIRSLRIPLGRSLDLPLVVLYKLGSFQHDPTVRKRLDRIFTPLHHTFVILP